MYFWYLKSVMATSFYDLTFHYKTMCYLIIFNHYYWEMYNFKQWLFYCNGVYLAEEVK